MSNPPQVYRNYDLLFTPRLIPFLRDLRSQEWTEFINKLSVLPETHSDALAFAAMMIELGGCLPCQMDSYRAQRGCIVCAQNTIFSFKGSDQQLFKYYDNARQVVANYLAEGELKRVA